MEHQHSDKRDSKILFLPYFQYKLLLSLAEKQENNASFTQLASIAFHYIMRMVTMSYLCILCYDAFLI